MVMFHRLTLLPYLIKHTPKNALPEISGANGPLKVYAFDLDHTIIKPKTAGSRFSTSADDWDFMNFSPGRSALDKLLSIVIEDATAQVVIFSNQGGVITVPSNSKSCTKYVEKIRLILKAISLEKDGNRLLERLWIYSSPKKPASFTRKQNKSSLLTKPMKVVKTLKKLNKPAPKLEEPMLMDPEIFTKMRKPETGMMQEFKKDLESIYPTVISIEVCHYCGDAAGRKQDFSDSDKQFAKNLDVPFKLPEDVF
ncbi:hypothetical protein HG535_0D01280 [Zygotorulaspora mrakii]|uniref:DNA 3'-phosphatase n=1 Tax=Zygotorulaspora mrakii TaxID=42260 RepID=A0A7H9B1B6_ZYGMR|nr:uncharacterized protein HG535_0D01280 [Zygotorulaspora mrakii]QLG72420.1 hypothetical protein HG535_0D01280 [Zygotorulaspora mrakii]